MKGVTKWFNDEKGFGFVTMEDGQEAFVHHSVIQSDGYRSLAEGDEVDLEVEEGPKGLKAVTVTKL